MLKGKVKTMKSIYLEEPGKVGIKECARPVRELNEAVITIKSLGICGSDIGAYRGANPLVSYPRVIGHEIAGEVLEIGENSNGIEVGDKVIVDPYVYCGECYPCEIGRTNCCENLEVLGVHIDGGMVEVLAHPAELLHKVPDNIPWEYIPAAETLTIALHAIHRTKLKKGEHVVINGAGPIGLLVALSAIEYGATPIMIDVVDTRLETSRDLGVKHTINLLKEDPVQKISDITNGRMAEVVIEASGANSAIRSTLDYASFAGRIAFTGWPKEDTELPTGLITKKELDIYGSRTSKGEFQEALELIASGAIDLSSIISKVVTFDEIPEAINELSEHPEKYLKINALV